jgi:hypothetical protein
MNLGDLIKQAAKNDDEKYSLFCTVKSVDKEKSTIVAEPINGDAPINGVKLITGAAENGVLLVPVVGSVVVVTFTSKTRGIVSLFSEVESVSLRGDQKGGVLIADEMRTQLDRMTARIDGVINALNSSSPDSSTGTFKASLTPLLKTVENLPVEDWENIENENVKHG